MASLMKQYSSLIVAAIRARRKKLKPGQPGFVYFEWHHIWPVAFGRDNRPQNLVLLTFPEHVLAHVLLAKLYSKAHKIQNVAARMLTDKKGDPVSVEAATEASYLASAATSEQNNRLHAEGKLALANQGSSHPSKKPENREALRKRMALANQEDSNPSKKPENRAAVGRRQTLAWSSDSNPAKKPENRAAQSERAKEQVQCPHCSKTGGWGGMLKWHFDSCLLHSDNLGLTRKQIKIRLQGLLK